MNDSILQNTPQHNPSMPWKVYKIISKIDANTVYIGSTKNKLLRQRLSLHKTEVRYYPNSKKNMWIVENSEFLDIVQISTKNNKEEALRDEEAEILKHVSKGYNVLNILLPTNGKNISAEAK